MRPAVDVETSEELLVIGELSHAEFVRMELLGATIAAKLRLLQEESQKSHEDKMRLWTRVVEASVEWACAIVDRPVEWGVEHLQPSDVEDIVRAYKAVNMGHYKLHGLE